MTVRRMASISPSSHCNCDICCLCIRTVRWSGCLGLKFEISVLSREGKSCGIDVGLGFEPKDGEES